MYLSISTGCKAHMATGLQKVAADFQAACQLLTCAGLHVAHVFHLEHLFKVCQEGM